MKPVPCPRFFHPDSILRFSPAPGNVQVPSQSVLELFIEASRPIDRVQTAARDFGLTESSFFEILRTAMARHLLEEEFDPPDVRAPIFVVSSPRSGSNLLYETLSLCEEFWTLAGENHAIMAGFPELGARYRDYESMRLTGDDLSDDLSRRLVPAFVRELRDVNGKYFLAAPPSERASTVRMLEKTPRNALRIPFFKALFPTAKFIFLYREPRAAIASIIEGWAEGFRTGRFVTERALPGWALGKWCFLLPPGWQALNGKTLAEVAAFQWVSANEIAMNDLEQMPSAEWCGISFEDFIADPAAECLRLCEFMGVNMSHRLAERVRDPLPTSRTALTPPGTDKWKKHESAIMSVLPIISTTQARLERLADKRVR